MVTSSDRGRSDPGKRIATGVALSSSALCAADLRLRGSADRLWRAPLDPMPDDGSVWPSLVSALRDLAGAVGVEGGSLAVTLLPPLTEVRRIELPPVKDEELQRLLARNAARYFVNARGPQMFGASPAGKRARGAPTPFVATAVPARLIAAIRNAAEEAGWTVASVAPAETAWAAAATAVWPELGRQPAWTVVSQSDRTDLLELTNGRLIGVRRFRPGAADAAMIAESVGSGAKVGVLGPPDTRTALATALLDQRVSVLSVAGDWSKTGVIPDALAAQFAGRDAGPVVRSEDAVVTARTETRRSVVAIASAAAALLLLAAGVELWGVHHQLGLVRAERERIRPQIAATMLGRTTVDATSRHLATLDAVERDAPQWTAIVTALSQAITDDAYLTAIRARGDSLVVDGLAEHASRVFDALQQTRLLVDIKSSAPVRREIQEDGTALDHFTISARVARPENGASSLPVGNPTRTGGGR